MTEPDPLNLHLAAQALDAGLRGDWGNAAHTILTLGEIGPGAITTAMIAWIDTYAHHATGGIHQHHHINVDTITTVDVRTGSPGGPVPDHVRWAANLIKARTEMNEGIFHSLMGDFDLITAEKRGRRVFAVLTAAALGIKYTPHGYALKD